MKIILVIIFVVLLSSCSTKHYDCYNWGKYDKRVLMDVIDYCKSDRMSQYKRF